MADSDNESGGHNASYGAGNSEYSSTREQDRFLPIANVSRIMKKALPANAKISKDAKETVQECVSEFISFITGEASDKCQREKRKTINGDDLLWAMTTLGFEEYVEPLKVYLHKFREIEGEKAGASSSSSSSSQSHHKDGSSGSGGAGGGGMYSGGGAMMAMGQHHLHGFSMATQVEMERGLKEGVFLFPRIKKKNSLFIHSRFARAIESWRISTLVVAFARLWIFVRASCSPIVLLLQISSLWSFSQSLCPLPLLMDLSCSWDSDDEYEKFIQRMNPPRVVIDNETSATATVVRVDSANKYGILLEVVQVLIDLNLIIKKAYITSDGGWFMDVFNVTDRDGKKLSDEATISGIVDYIRKSLESDSCFVSSRRELVDVAPSVSHTSIELSGTDRPGLLSEVSAVLTDLKCNVVNAEVWTHNARAAAVMHVTDEATGSAVTDPEKLSKIRELLCNVLKGSNKTRGAKTAVSMGVTHTDRRLHQLMFADRDYERSGQDSPSDNARPNVTVVKWYDKDYSLVTVRCKDRPKLLFDTVCTLTDMQYVVFHGNVDAEKPEAYQEFYIKHVDGSPVNSEAERRRVVQCLQAAIERRVSEDLKLELCTGDRIGLLSEVTRIFRENSLTVTRAEVTTRGGKAVNTFYVRDAAGYPVDSKIITAIRQAIGQTILQVKDPSKCPKSPRQESPARFLFGGLFKSRSFYNFGFG